MRKYSKYTPSPEFIKQFNKGKNIMYKTASGEILLDYGIRYIYRDGREEESKTILHLLIDEAPKKEMEYNLQISGKGKLAKVELFSLEHPVSLNDNSDFLRRAGGLIDNAEAKYQ